MLDLNPLGPGIQNIVDFRKGTQCMCCTLCNIPSKDWNNLWLLNMLIFPVKHVIVRLLGINEEHTLPRCTSGFAVKLATKTFQYFKAF